MGYVKIGKYLINKATISKTPLDYFLKDLNLDDYVFIKKTNVIRLINKNELEKYAGFILIKKSEFDEHNFNLWCKWIKENVKIIFLSKLYKGLHNKIGIFPNFDPYEKIKEIII